MVYTNTMHSLQHHRHTFAFTHDSQHMHSRLIYPTGQSQRPTDNFIPEMSFMHDKTNRLSPREACIYPYAASQIHCKTSESFCLNVTVTSTRWWLFESHLQLFLCSKIIIFVVSPDVVVSWQIMFDKAMPEACRCFW